MEQSIDVCAFDEAVGYQSINQPVETGFVSRGSQKLD